MDMNTVNETNHYTFTVFQKHTSCSDFKVKVNFGVAAGEAGSMELFCPLKDCSLLQNAGLHFLLVLLCSNTMSPSSHK